MIKHGHSAARGREKSTGAFISFMQPADESRVTQHSPKHWCRGHAAPNAALETPRPSFSFCSSHADAWCLTSLPKGQGKAFAAPVLTPARTEHLQETRDAPGLDAGSSLSPEGLPMQAQHHEKPSWKAPGSRRGSTALSYHHGAARAVVLHSGEE